MALLRTEEVRGGPRSAFRVQRTVFLLLWLFPANLFASIDITEVGRPAFRIFTDRDGVPEMAIEAMAIDRKGYLWIGTQAGAATYNGRQWITVNMPNRKISNYILSILAASDGSVWFGKLAGGISVLKDNSWTNYDRKSGLPGEMVSWLLESRNENREPILWAATDHGLARFERNRWTKVEGLPDNDVRTILETVDPNGDRVLWVGTYNGGLARLKQNQWSIFNTKSGLPSNKILSLLETVADDGDHVLWVGTARGGLARLKDNQWTVFDKSSGLPDDEILTIQESILPDGTRQIWVGTDNGGLARLENGRWITLDRSNGLPNNTIGCLLMQNSHHVTQTIWIGTYGGLVRYDQGKWTTIREHDGEAITSVNSALDTGSSFWIGMNTGGLARFQDGKWTIYHTGNSGLPHDSIKAIVASNAQNGAPKIWVGTEDGFAGFAGDQWTVYNAGNSRVPDNAIRALWAARGDDGEEILWIGTRAGLARFLPQSSGRDAWKIFDTTTGLPSSTVRCLQEGKSAAGHRSLWIGTRNGLARMEGERIVVYSTKNSGLPSDNVNSILASKDAAGENCLWIGTSGGLARFYPDSPQPRWLTLSDLENSNPRLPDNTIYHISEDRKGRIYLLTNKGVACLTPRSATQNNTAVFDVITYTTEDGLSSNEGNTGVSPIDSKGRIWVNLIGGAGVFDPADEIADSTIKPLHVHTLQQGKDKKLSANQELEYNGKFLSFEFALLNYSHESDTRYRTQLVGLDDHPSEWTANYRKEYPTLPEGNYLFKVWGRDHAGNISGPVEMGFRILPVPWRTWWAYLCYAIALTGAGYYSHRFRVRQLKAREMELIRVVEERTQDLRQASEKLHLAQERIDRLQESAPQALDNLSAWSKAAAEDIARSIGSAEIDIWTLENEEFKLMSGKGTKTLSLKDLRSMTPPTHIVADSAEIVLPLRGLRGELYGALVVSGAGIVWGEAERRLITGFAHQLGGTLETQHMAKRLAQAEERKALKLQEMQEHGISTLEVCPKCGRCYDDTVERCEQDGTKLQAPRILPYRILDRYRLRRMLGEGGMGAVFEAYDEKLDRSVAVKIIRAELLVDPSMRLRLEREAHMVARIQHPGVVFIYDFGEIQDSSNFIVMELLQGVDLGTVLKIQGPGSPAQVATVLSQVGEALTAAHAHGIIHRDLKPANLFLIPSGNGFTVKVVDFGLAKSVAEETSLTISGVLLGSPSYMSPEQIRYQPLDERSDLFSLASVIYELLTGSAAFVGESVLDVLITILADDPVPLSDRLPGVDKEIDQAFFDAFQKDFEKRTTSVSLWVGRVVPLLQQMNSTAPGWNIAVLNKNAAVPEEERIAVVAQKGGGSTAEHWPQVEHLFYSALERPPEDRSRFLAESCAGDSELKKKVEALLEIDKRIKED